MKHFFAWRVEEMTLAFLAVADDPAEPPCDGREDYYLERRRGWRMADDGRRRPTESGVDRYAESVDGLYPREDDEERQQQQQQPKFYGVCGTCTLR